MPLFLIYFFVHDTGRNRRNTLLLHGCCRLEATGSRIEAGFRLSALLFLGFKVKVRRGNLAWQKYHYTSVPREAEGKI
jgi:hypothetical protein